MTDTTKDHFDTLGRVLLRCWIIGFAMLFIWFGAVMIDAVRNVHGPLTGLSNHELDVIHYCGIGLFKLMLLVFFFIPWLAIRLVLRQGQAKP